MKKLFATALLSALFISGNAEDLYRKYQPEKTYKIKENIGWSITYSYNARDTKNPRLLLIGDSICNAYQGSVRKELAKKMNVTYWVTSKCLTEKNYFRELELILDGSRYDVISFNNGLHSFKITPEEWGAAFRNAVAMIRKKCPEAKLFLTTSTPLTDSRTEHVRKLNKFVHETAKAENLPVIDLFALMEPLDHKQYWKGDRIHFKPAGVAVQAKEICRIMNELPILAGKNANIVQKGSKTGPNGAIK